MEYMQEDVRDSTGKVIAVRLMHVDGLGRAIYTDIPTSVASGVSLADVVAAVGAQANAAIRAGTAGPQGPAMTAAQVQAVATQVKAKKR